MTTAKISSANISKLNVLPMASILNITDNPIVIDVAMIKPITAGLIPPIIAWTGFFSIRFLANIEISSINKYAGRVIASVASIAPRMPPWDAPTNVAILIEIGPGVLSHIAI